MPFHDRRVRRAHSPLLAVGYYLDRVRERCDLPAIVVSDGTDVLAGSGVDIDALAAAGASMLGGDTERTLGDEDFFAHNVTIGGRASILTSRGGRVDRVRKLEADITRILA